MPLENRLDELYSVVQFVDDRRLPRAFRFFHRHRVVDERQGVGLQESRPIFANLSPVFFAAWAIGASQLPRRTNEIASYSADRRTVGHARRLHANRSIISRKAYISEMDLLRLQMLFRCAGCRPTAHLGDKQSPNYSSKLQSLAELLDGLFAALDWRLLLFSEWTTTLDLIEPLLR